MLPELFLCFELAAQKEGSSLELPQPHHTRYLGVAFFPSFRQFKAPSGALARSSVFTDVIPPARGPHWRHRVHHSCKNSWLHCSSVHARSDLTALLPGIQQKTLTINSDNPQRHSDVLDPCGLIPKTCQISFVWKTRRDIAGTRAKCSTGGRVLQQSLHNGYSGTQDLVLGIPSARDPSVCLSVLRTLRKTNGPLAHRIPARRVSRSPAEQDSA